MEEQNSLQKSLLQKNKIGGLIQAENDIGKQYVHEDASIRRGSLA